MAITAEHFRRLLDAGDGAHLVVDGDRAAVVDPDVGPPPGGTGPVPPGGDGGVVLSAADLRARLAGHEPSEEMLEALARRLDAAADARET